MIDTGYRLVIHGTRPDFTVEHVADALAPRLKHPPEDIARALRSGQTIKLSLRGLALEAARALKKSMETSGCATTLESLAPSLPAAPVIPGNFSTDGLRPLVGDRARLVLNAPADWRNASDDEYLRVLHTGTRSVFTASCNVDPGVDLAVWAEVRLGSVAQSLPFLRPILPPMRLATEAGPAVVAEYRGRKPGDEADTHQLVLCLCPPEGAISLNITSTSADFERHQALYQWLLRTQLRVFSSTSADPADWPGMNHARAQFEMGWRFAAADDFAAAARWFARAAMQGHAEAQYHLANFNGQGRGVPKDDTLAFQWMRRSAEQSWVPAQEALARMYIHGVGVGPDPDQAALWQRRVQAARAQGSARG